MQDELFECKSSKILICFLVISYLGGILSVIFYAKLNIFIKLIIIGVCLISFVKNSIEIKLINNIFWNKNTGWKLRDESGKYFPVKLTGLSVCTPWVISLNFKCKTVFICCDAMNKNAWRRLKVLLINL